MKRGRKADPESQYRVYLHKNNGYRYASIQKPVETQKSEKKNNDKDEKEDKESKKKYKTIHLGTVDENNVFYPYLTFQLMPVSERIRLQYPKGWDISRANALNDADLTVKGAVETGDQTTTSNKEGENQVLDAVNNNCDPSPNNYGGGSGLALSSNSNEEEHLNAKLNNISNGTKPSDTILDQFNNKLYGSFWILEEISKNCGLYDDLFETFEGNVTQVHGVLSLAFYPYLSGKTYNRFAKWQCSHKTLLDNQLSSAAITKLTQSITDNHRMKLIGLRVARQPKGAILDCDSTTRSGWGTCIAELCWGHNKDNPKLQNTVEAYVYSITTHEPVYFRSFPGYTNDITTVRTILIDLHAVGISDVVFMADRGYPSDENLAMMVEASLPFLMCAKIGNEPIAPLLENVKYDNSGMPVNMNFDSKRKLYYLQVEIPPYKSRLADDTIVDMTGLKANLFLNHRRRVDELALLQEQIKGEETILNKAIETNQIPGDIKKYNAMFKYYKVEYTYAPKDKDKKKPVGICVTACDNKINKEKAQCGFFCSVMYKYDIDGLRALEIYKARDEHEKNFDILKNQMLFYNQRNSSEEGRDGRALISFVGLIPITKFRYAWKDHLHETYESSLDMLDEMEPIRFSEYTDGSSSMTSFTEKQITICDACGVEPPRECIPATIRKIRDSKKNPQKRGRKPKQE